jgi:hypothetical protein
MDGKMKYALLYVICTAISVIFIRLIGTRMPDMLLIFMSTSFAILFFNVHRWKSVTDIYARIIKLRTAFIVINTLMLIQWFGSFLIPVYFSPAAFIISLFSILSLLSSYMLYRAQKKKSQLIKLLLLSLSLISFYIMYGFSYPGMLYLIFLFSTLSVGIVGYTYLRVSAKLNQQNFTAIEILSFRFWLLWLVSLAYVLYDHQFAQLDFIMIPQTLLIATVTLIIPIYFSQKSIEKIGPDKSGLIFGFTPLAITMMEHWVIKTPLDDNLIFSLSLLLIIGGFFTYEFLKKKSILHPKI